MNMKNYKNMYGAYLIKELEKNIQLQEKNVIKYVDMDVQDCGISSWATNAIIEECKMLIDLIRNSGKTEVMVLIDKETNNIASIATTKYNHWILETSDGVEYVNMKTKRSKKYFEEVKMVLPAKIETICGSCLGSATYSVYVASNINYCTGEYKKLNTVYQV